MDKRKSFIIRIGFKTLIVLITLVSISGIFFIRTTQALSIFTVTNTNDAGTGSFRQAILNANATPGFDIISFSIPGLGVKTILPLTPLPPITDSVFIDGWSQGGLTYNGPPLIEISGVNVQVPEPGLRIGVDNSTVRGLIINGFSSNFAEGIRINGNSNVVKGCYIGTTANGEAASSNAGRGIFINSGGHDNVIGGITMGARNVVSGNLGAGIVIASDDNRVQGNYVGLSASGLLALGNGTDGVQILGANNLVGGSSAAARNVISGNGSDGIELHDIDSPGASNNRIEGNYIGTKPDGLSGGVGNHEWGVFIPIGFAHNNTIGGLTPRFGNVISGNGSVRGEGGGIVIGTRGNSVQNNLIGVAADRTTNLGNLGDGILIGDPENRIGGSFTFSGVTFSFGNIIAFNQGTGIRIAALFSAVENRISRNEIYSNGGLGIDLEPLGVTANDFCDGDTGANNLQNFPVITSVTPAPGGGITIAGLVRGPFNNYRIELFNNQHCDPSGNGEGERFLGSTTAISAKLAFCRAFFMVTFSDITIGQADFITATATDPSGNTSEFSACFEVH